MNFPILAAIAASVVAEPKFDIHLIDGTGNPGAESCAIADVNNDGRLDIVSAGSWYEAPNWTKHKIRDIPVTNGYVDSFSDLPIDVDGDGFVDLIQIGYFAHRIVWMKNPGRSGGPWTENLIDAIGPTEFAFLVDLDNDGRARELLPQFTGAANAPLCWYELRDAKWIKHVVSDHSYGHGIGVGDINGDGRNDIITPIGWLEAPADPRASGNWVFHPEPWNQRTAAPAVPPPPVVRTPGSRPDLHVVKAELESVETGGTPILGPARSFSGGSARGSITAMKAQVQGRTIAGLRIEALDGDRKETAYLDDAMTPEIGRALAELAANENSGPIGRGTISYLGSGVLWQREGGQLPLNVQMYRRADGETGLAIAKTWDPNDRAGGQFIYFPGLQPSVFASLFAAAQRDLGSLTAVAPAPAAAPPAAVPSVRPIEFGFIHVLDINGDGRKDLLSTDGHNYGIYWIEQRPDGSWLRHEIDRRFSESHSSVLVDFNGDGQPDLVTGKRFEARNQNDPGVGEPLGVYWYEFRKAGDGSIAWTRHTISEGGQMGTGLQLRVVDLDGDGDLDVVASGKSGLYFAERK